MSSGVVPTCPRAPWRRPALALAVLPLALVLALSGCGGGDDEPPTVATTGTVPVQPAPPDPSDPADCDLFAANGGSDDQGDGSFANPWEHVDFLVGKLRDVDGRRVGCLRSGTFTPTGTDESGGEPSMRFDAPNVTLMSFPGERARIVGRIYVSDLAAGATIADLDLAMQSNNYPGTTCRDVCGNSSFPIAGSGVTVRGNDISNDDTDICVQLIDNGSGPGTDAVLSGNRIHNCGPYAPRSNTAHAIYVSSAISPEISDNVIYDNGAFGVKLAPRAVGGTVSNNVLDLNAVGVLVGDQPPCPGVEEASRDNLIADNVATRAQARNNIEGFWTTSAEDPGCFDIGDETRGNVVSGNCLYADNPDSDGPDVFYNVNGGLGVRSVDVPQSGGFQDDGTNVAIEPSAQPEMPPIYADPVNGGYHLVSAAGEGNDCLEVEGITDAAATANSRWQAPMKLADAAADPAPVAAVGPDGSAASAWVDDGRVIALVRGPGAQTGPTRWDPINPSEERPLAEAISEGGGASEATIAAGGSGRTRLFVAAWRRGAELEAAVWSRGSWGEPAVLDGAGDLGAPAVAAGADGSAVVVWRRGEEIAAARLPAGAPGFEPAQAVAGGAVSEPRIAVGGGGFAAAVWSGQTDDGQVVTASELSEGAWSDPTMLSEPGADADQPDIAASTAPDDATAMAVWRRDEGDGSVVQSAIRSSGGDWDEAVTISGTSPVIEEPSVAIGSEEGDDGSAVVSWTVSADDERVIVAAVRAPGGGFEAPQPLSAAGDVASARVAVGPDGAAIVSWVYFDEGVGYDRVLASTRSSGSEWSFPRALSTIAPGASASAPWPAVGVPGSGLVVWAEQAGGGAAVMTSGFWF